MSVSHHLRDETLQDYAAGNLSMSMETLVACHLTVCPSCRRTLQLAEVLAGDLLQRETPATVQLTAAELLASANCSIQNTDEQVVSAMPVTGVPRPLARHLPASLEELEWSRLAPGIKQFNLSNQHRRHGAFKLLHCAPGVVLSHHSHNDPELTFIVRGSYQDEIGRFRAGDIADLDLHHEHQPVVDTEEPCIALIATQSPVKYSSMFARIMQPYVGI